MYGLFSDATPTILLISMRAFSRAVGVQSFRLARAYPICTNILAHRPSRANPILHRMESSAAFALPMRPTSRMHKEFDIGADIALIDEELHANDDMKEMESKQVRLAESPSSHIPFAHMSLLAIWPRSDLCSATFRKFCWGCASAPPPASMNCWLETKRF